MESSGRVIVRERKRTKENRSARTYSGVYKRMGNPEEKTHVRIKVNVPPSSGI